MEEKRIIETSAREIIDRNIDTVTDEIVTLCRQAQSMLTCYIIEIGRRLKEAKSMLGHGEWGNWLREKVNFSQSTANNYMKIFEEYGSEQISFFGEAKSQTLGNLPYAKALKLLAVPEEEREGFVEANNVEDISTRELDKLIKERDEALKARDAECERADKSAAALAELEAERLKKEALAQKEIELNKQISELESALALAKDKEKKAKERLKALKENPEVSEEYLECIRKNAEEKAALESAAELQKKTDEMNVKLGELMAEKAEAEKKEAESAARLIVLEKKLKLSSPEATAFKIKFEMLQKAYYEVSEALQKVRESSPELADKLDTAIKAFAESITNKT